MIPLDDEIDFDDSCEKCGCSLQVETCWQCGGAGGWHDCGDDTCCCLNPDEDLNDECDICNGKGEYSFCPKCAREGE